MSSRMALVPREHGFWVMLTAVLLCALMQSNTLTLTLVTTAALVALASALAGGVIRRRVRRSGTAQLASAAVLALAGVPVAFVAKLPLSQIAVTTTAWAIVFVASALVVQGELCPFGEARLPCGRAGLAGDWRNRSSEPRLCRDGSRQCRTGNMARSVRLRSNRARGAFDTGAQARRDRASRRGSPGRLLARGLMPHPPNPRNDA